MVTHHDSFSDVGADTLRTLQMVERRVLWLASNIVHRANARPNPDGSKIGGHQASSASVVSLLTALYFHHLQAGDRVAIKPHASPVYHAIQYLLGNLERRYLPMLRQFGGLQAYPSRTKDPVRVDFSTGSVGLGAGAPAFAALAHQYASRHFGAVTSRRFYSLVGDAELDEGNVWEALLEHSLQGTANITWIIDLNRQSLDRVVPGIKAEVLRQHFATCGWNVVDLKYGRALSAAFERPHGHLLRACIDAMSNETYQRLLRMPGDEVRVALLRQRGDPALARLLDDMSDEEVRRLLGDLGGHDLGSIIDALAAADAVTDRPTAIFAYTIKGWMLPFAGDPLNHSKLMTPDQMDELRRRLVVEGDEWASFEANSPEGRLCAAARVRLEEPPPPPPALWPHDIPESLDVTPPPVTGTQQAFGRLMVQIARHPEVARRIVTAAPDVATSTSLSGWVLKRGLFDVTPDTLERRESLLDWKPSPTGQHIEFGISEMNLFMFLGMFGLSADLSGQQLIPIGTVYDPFVLRGLDALLYGLYSGSRFIVVGTPSGISLAPEGGAHQSTVTPSIGMELPELDAYEPCYAREVEWLLLEALRQCTDRVHGRSSYFRLSTKPVEQQPFQRAQQRLGEAELRRQVLAGGYRLVDWRDAEPVRPRSTLIQLVSSGAMIPEALLAAEDLHRRGIAVNVLNLTSPRLLFESWREHHAGFERHGPFDWLVPPNERQAPLVTVVDGASHALSWLGSVYGAPVYPLGVDGFGQSGCRADLYRHYGIDATAITAAALQLVDRLGLRVAVES